MNPSDLPHLASRLRLLKRVVIALTALCVALSIALIVLGVQLSKQGAQDSVAWKTGPAADPLGRAYDGFADWPLDRQIREASVVAVVRYDRTTTPVRCIVDQVLKRDPNVEFYFEEGQEYIFCHPTGDTFSDGMIHYFVGNPAESRYATSYKGGRVLSDGYITIEELRRKASTD